MFLPVQWFYEVSDQLLGKLDVKYLHLQNIMKWIPLLIHIHNVFNKKSSCSELSVASGLHYHACLAKDCYFMILFLWHMMTYVDRRFPMQKRLKKGSFALASSREHQKEVDQADCSLRAFFVLKGHNFRREADNCGTVLGI